MKKTGMIGLILALSLVFVLGTGCTKYATDEELAQLEKQRDAALAAEQALADCEEELANLESQRADLQAQLQEVEDEREAVMQRMAEEQRMKVREMDADGEGM